MEAQTSEAASLLLGLPDPEPAEEQQEPDQGLEVSPSEGEATGPLQVAAESGSEQEKLTVKGLAEKLGMDAKDLYESLTLDIGEGLTLGQVKDRAKDLARSDELLAEIESRRIRADQELLTKQEQIELLGIKLTPDQEALAKDRRDEYLTSQSSRVMKIIPEWNDPTTKAAEVGAIHELFQGYGFSSAELNHVADSRLIKAMNDYARLLSRVESARNKEVKEPRKQGQRNRSQQATNNTSKAMKGFKDGTLSRDATVAALIADG